MHYWLISLSIATVALFLPLSLISRIPIRGDLVLEDDRYDMVDLSAPVAEGHLLKILAYLISDSPLGSVLGRYLLDSNQMILVRELGSRLNAWAPMYYPVHHIDGDEWNQAVKGKDDMPLDELLTDKEENSPLLVRRALRIRRGNGDSARGRGVNTIHDYASAYRTRGDNNSPTAVMRRTLAAIRRLEERGLKIFSSVQEEDVLAQARSSEERIRNDNALSVMDGVPVVIKDMIDVRGHWICNGQRGTSQGPGDGDANANDKKARELSEHAWQAYTQAEICRYAEEDDPIIANLRATGAIILGITVMTEGGVTPLGWNAHWQVWYSSGVVYLYSFRTCSSHNHTVLQSDSHTIYVI
jgi:hypothetical protein